MYIFIFLVLFIFIIYVKNKRQPQLIQQNEHFINEIDKLIGNKMNDDPVIPPLPDYNSLQNQIIKSKKPIIEKRTVVRGVENKCRFIPSHTNSKCDDKVYTKFSGASLGIGAKSIQCNGKKILNNRAKAISLIKNGKIDRIIITKKGNHYKKEPKVTIEGTGIGRAILKNKQVDKILLLNRGNNYKSSPKITIEAPNLFSYCNLCCTI